AEAIRQRRVVEAHFRLDLDVRRRLDVEGQGDTGDVLATIGRNAQGGIDVHAVLVTDELSAQGGHEGIAHRVGEPGTGGVYRGVNRTAAEAEVIQLRADMELVSHLPAREDGTADHMRDERVFTTSEAQQADPALV